MPPPYPRHSRSAVSPPAPVLAPAYYLSAPAQSTPAPPTPQHWPTPPLAVTRSMSDIWSVGGSDDASVGKAHASEDWECSSSSSSGGEEQPRKRSKRAAAGPNKRPKVGGQGLCLSQHSRSQVWEANQEAQEHARHSPLH